MIAFPTTG